MEASDRLDRWRMRFAGQSLYVLVAFGEVFLPEPKGLCVSERDF